MSRVPLVVPIAVGAFFGAITTRFAVGDSDVFWHLALGQDALRGYLGTPDALSGRSWTALAAPGSVDQWLGQLVLALAYAGGGWRGLVALRALAVAALVGLIVYAALRERPLRPLGAVVAALPAIALSRFVWTERPELFGFVCFALLVVLLRAGRAGSDRALYFIPPLVLVWTNLHGSFALGAVLVLLVSLEGLAFDPARRRAYAIAGVGAVVATLLPPAGPAAWTAPGLHLLHPPRAIQEWSVPDVTTLPGAIFGLTLFATLLVALLDRRSTPREALVLLPVLFISLTAVRQMPLFAIAAVPYLAAHADGALGSLASQLGLRLPGRGAAAPPPGRAVDAAAGALAAAVLAAAMATGIAAPSLDGFPTSALAALRPGPGLLNAYDWGGYLIWAAPQTPVFVDGRLVPFLGAVLDDYTAVVGVHPGWHEVIARRQIRQILVRPSDPIAVRAHDLGWPVAAASERFVLFDVP